MSKKVVRHSSSLRLKKPKKVKPKKRRIGQSVVGRNSRFNRGKSAEATFK